MIPIVLHIPHASRVIPAEERATFVLDDTALERELTAITDAWTDELVDGWSERYTVQRVIAPVSRLVCDVERFRMTARRRWLREAWARSIRGHRMAVRCAR
ncbi:MAG: hypothetical protein KatS3mg116_3693 [Elioraea sp.]|nr:N-formylglutamate amidohydrolase [Elioraea sp.]GIX11983.1 MAG: hypothetical protein KatS3mg116_3693 [Elioraea sp.]